MHYPTSGSTTQTEFDESRRELNAPLYGFENAAWSFQILPFAEQNNLSERRRDLQLDWNIIYDEDIALYTCPSRGGSEKMISQGTEREFSADYAGVMGTWNADYVNGGSGVWPSGDTRWDDASTELAFQWQTNEEIIPNEAVNVWVGIIIKEAHVIYESDNQATVTRIGTVTNVADGTSNTLMFAEKARDARFYTMIAEDAESGGFWEGGISKPSDWPCMRGFMKNPALTADSFQREPTSDGEIPFEPDFGSAHPGTTNAVLGDGSVHALSNTTNGVVLYDATTRGGGEVVDINNL